MSEVVIQPFPKKLVIAVSSSAILDMRKPNKLFVDAGEAAFVRYMDKNACKPLALGAAAHFVHQMLSLNDYGIDVSAPIVSRMNPFGHSRVDASLAAHDGFARMLNRAGESPGGIYTNGTPIDPAFLKAMKADLFLTTNRQDSDAALAAGVPAVVVPAAPLKIQVERFNPKLLECAYDADRVLVVANGRDGDVFDGDSEAFFNDAFNRTGDLSGSLHTYRGREIGLKTLPADPGPMAGFYLTMCAVRDHVKSLNRPDGLVVKNRIVTARELGAVQRVQTTLRSWSAEPDGFFSCGATPKATYLNTASIFFDDGLKHIQGAPKHVLTGHVPWNELTRHQPFKANFAATRRQFRGWKPAQPDTQCV